MEIREGSRRAVVEMMIAGIRPMSRCLGELKRIEPPRRQGAKVNAPRRNELNFDLKFQI
jgi:hypothetical protein